MNFDTQIIQKHLTPLAVGSDIRLFATVASTNRVLRDLATTGAPEGTVVIADEQTAGHGRLAKPWFSPPGVNLYVSVLEVRGEGPSYEGRVLGVDREGYLLLRDPLGKRRRVLTGEIRLSD